LRTVSHALLMAEQIDRSRIVSTCLHMRAITELRSQRFASPTFDHSPGSSVLTRHEGRRHPLVCLRSPSTLNHRDHDPINLRARAQACTPTPSTTVDAPATPQAGNVIDTAAVESVRAYLRTFKLNEKELAAGFTIPFAFHPEGWAYVGAARATGRTGPKGHQVYEVVVVSGGQAPGEGSGSQGFLEISPEDSP